MSTADLSAGGRPMGLRRRDRATRGAPRRRSLVAAGYPAVDQTQIARTLGTDGGVVCEDPNSALKQGLWLTNLADGAAGPGQRPVIADSRVLHAGAP